MEKKQKETKKKIPHPSFLLFICFFLFLQSVPLNAFPIPETLHYDLTWFGIKAGTSSLSIKDNGNTYIIKSRADSAKWLSVFYTVRDRIESVIKKNRMVLVCP